MYVESKPTTTFADMPEWKMPSPQPVGTLKRPPLIKNGSSSSSLSGMEQSVPSFQSFIKRTPPPDQHKPLPPTPLNQRRASNYSPPRSRTPSSHYSTRRTSSVYSRTVSQWDLDDISWRSADFADEPVPPLPTLQALAYSSSTPQLLKTPAAPPPPVPRKYSPLIITPSPTASRTTTPSPPPQQELSILLPTPPPSVQIPKNHMRTVSLEKAKAALNAPGAVHLLPEEMRAQTLGKSRSHEPLRVASTEIIGGITPPTVPEPPVLVDNQGRSRSILSPDTNIVSPTEYPFHAIGSPSSNSRRFFKVGTGPEKSMVPLASQQRQASKEKVVQTLGIGDDEEIRGRTRYRGPRTMESSHRVAGYRNDSASDGDNDAQNIAKEYHSLLADHHRKGSSYSDPHGTDSDDSVTRHMQMVPQPLFQNKPPARLPGSVTRRDTDTSMSPYHLRKDSTASDRDRRGSSGSSRKSFPFRLSLTPESTHRLTSTSGSIPISPPTEGSPLSIQSTEPRFEKRRKPPRPRKNSGDTRVSAYYPHVASRKGKNSKPKVDPLSRSRIPPMPLLSTDLIAEELKTPERTPEVSPLRSMRTSSSDRKNRFRRGSDTAVQKVRQPLHQRVVKGAAKYADLLTKPAELPARHNYQPITAATVAPGSPHLLPSPVKSPSPLIRLGWSDKAKSEFDESRSPIQSSKRLRPEPSTLTIPQFTHITTPARPLDETQTGLQEMEMPRRKGSIFGGMLEGWKESKAERRREELKKIIKMVPEEAGSPGGIKRRSSTFGWM